MGIFYMLNRLIKIERDYGYVLPQKYIAVRPAWPRARLLVYNRKTSNIFHKTFLHLNDYLPPKSLIIFNDTKVIPARLHAHKETSGKIEIFFLGKDKNKIQAFLSPALAIGRRAYITKKIFFDVIGQQEKIFILKPNFPAKQLGSILQKYGSTPLPPYIKDTPLTEKQAREQYQAVFAKVKGSVAAPTASLHFTKKLLRFLRAKGHSIGFITLHVNLGTFAPLTDENIRTGRLHEETFFIPASTRRMIRKAKQQNRPIIACGTTVVRAIESSSQEIEFRKKSEWQKTDLFIKPGYRFRIIDGLITNFHLPKSSLLMLVAAFMGKKELLRVYQKAIREKYRFYSFGDGMLIL